jgi:hypothetical protein
VLRLLDVRLLPVVFNLFVMPVVQRVLVVPKLLGRLLDVFLLRRACNRNAGRLRTASVLRLLVVCGWPSSASSRSADLHQPGTKHVQSQRTAADFSAGEHVSAATDFPRIAEAGTSWRFVVGPDSAAAAAEGARRCRLDES